MAAPLRGIPPHKAALSRETPNAVKLGSPPPLFCRRLPPLRTWSDDEQDGKQVFTSDRRAGGLRLKHLRQRYLCATQAGLPAVAHRAALCSAGWGRPRLRRGRAHDSGSSRGPLPRRSDETAPGDVTQAHQLMAQARRFSPRGSVSVSSNERQPRVTRLFRVARPSPTAIRPRSGFIPKPVLHATSLPRTQTTERNARPSATVTTCRPKGRNTRRSLRQWFTLARD